MKSFLLILLCLLCQACSDIKDKPTPKKAIYLSPWINYKGQFKPGYVRKSVSTNPDALRNQTRSKYYYQTKGKYRRKH